MYMYKVLLLVIAITNIFAEYGFELIIKSKNSGLYAIPNTNSNTDIDYSYKNKVELGKKLYFESRISKSNTVSCNTCHNLSLSGTSQSKILQLMKNYGYRTNKRLLDIPTVYNVIFSKALFWDGIISNDDSVDVLKLVVSRELLLDSTKDYIVTTITNNKSYVIEFKKAYGNNVNIDFDLISSTIALFVSTLITPSRYDDFLSGNIKALSKEEQSGLNLFIDKNCTACHSGVNLGSNVVSRASYSTYNSILSSYKTNTIKVPTLRNVIETAPYFHNASVDNIRDAIYKMLGHNVVLTDDEINKMIAFLNALNGRKPSLIYPILPN